MYIILQRKKLLTYLREYMQNHSEVKYMNQVTGVRKGLLMSSLLNLYKYLWKLSSLAELIQVQFSLLSTGSSVCCSSLVQDEMDILNIKTTQTYNRAYPLLTIPLPTCRSLVQRCR